MFGVPALSGGVLFSLAPLGACTSGASAALVGVERWADERCAEQMKGERAIPCVKEESVTRRWWFAVRLTSLGHFLLYKYFSNLIP